MLSQGHALADIIDSVPVQVQKMVTAQAYGVHRQDVTKNPKLLVEDIEHFRKAPRIVSKGHEEL